MTEPAALCIVGGKARPEGDGMDPVAVGIFCKTPAAGFSKTRLSPPLRLDECAALSACFIRDLAGTIGELTQDGGVTGYAVYTPVGTEAALRKLLPPGFRLLPQCEGDFGVRIATATRELLENHDGAILVNADSPTLPASILRAAVNATRRRDAVVLSPALDGGYTLIGLSGMHEQLFVDIPWSTPQVHRTDRPARCRDRPAGRECSRLVRRRRCRVAGAAAGGARRRAAALRRRTARRARAGDQGAFRHA